MPGWSYLIVAGALVIGLKQSISTRYRPLAVCAIVVVAVAYAGWRQHAY
jgi:hypothetical protein